jgi:allantoate deiminase/N-carbamoyl-L-amino-acid hydrolase
MELIISAMREAGMDVQVDPVGNVVGVCSGTECALPAVMTGSHLDTVPDGGALDGALGLVAAIECVGAWHRAGWRPRRTVKVVATIEEEGTRFGLGCLGSRAMAGELTGKSPEDFKDAQGRTLGWHLQQMGLKADTALQAAKIDTKGLACFLELHIEQGEELDLSGTPCAIVTDIAGIDRHWVEITGNANHAGTTRMDRRQDALVAAAALVTDTNRRALASKGRYVATVGKLEVSPNATNIIPGQVRLVIETRGADPDLLEAVHAGLPEHLAGLQAEYGVQAEIRQRLYAPPAPLDTGMIAALQAAAAKAGVSPVLLPSWAGHDAKILTTVVPTGMIFVPTIGGISHSPLEDTRWEHVAEGLRLFDRALKDLAE